MKHSKLLIFLAFSITFLSQTTILKAQNMVVVPNNFTSNQGLVIDVYPFGCGAEPDSPSVRYQQIYLGSEIGQSGDISNIGFRLNSQEPMGFNDTLIPNVQIDMSITQANPSNPNCVFAENLGPVVTTVFSNDLILSAQNCNSNPCPFDIIIPLQNQFPFNPAEGNLIIDIRIPNCISLPGFDGALPTDIGLMSRTLNEFSVDSPTCNQNELSGIVTKFWFGSIRTDSES